MAQATTGANVERLPDHMQSEAAAYVERGRPAGGFLMAVLMNDFQQAVAQADGTNRENLKEWGMWLFNDIPAASWGSRENVEEWMEQGGMSGR